MRGRGKGLPGPDPCDLYMRFTFQRIKIIEIGNAGHKGDGYLDP
ncbi:hypothetical protein JCM25156A_29220 [Komagataeibacter kakiaceti JCM 25156]